MAEPDPLECIRAKIREDEILRRDLHSLILFGSYVRGDFVDGVSDIDFLAVFRTAREGNLRRLREILEDCTSGIPRKLVDAPWELLENLDDPMRKGFPYKLLTVYQEDFIRNHVVVYGEEISDLLPRYDKEELLSWRAERLLDSISRFEGDPEILKLSAGEVARLMAIANGAKGIAKDEILSVLEALGDEDALEVYRTYVEGRELEVPEGFLVEFIASRMRAYLKSREAGLRGPNTPPPE
jgi:predicted nucleotidyltransferase